MRSAFCPPGLSFTGINKVSTFSISRVLISFALGFTSLVVFFAAGSAFEVTGQNSIREIVAACLVGATYLAFCQFWIAPTGIRGVGGKWPTLVAMTVPLLLVLPFIDRGAILGTGIPLVVSGCLGSLVGALLSERVAASHPLDTTAGDGMNRLKHCRHGLKIGAGLLAVMALLVALGVIPPLLADSTPGFNARPVAKALWVAVALGLLAAGILAFASLPRRTPDRIPDWTLGAPAILSFLLTLFYAFASGIGSQSPALLVASALLMFSAALALVITALVTVTFIFSIRASRTDG